MRAAAGSPVQPCGAPGEGGPGRARLEPNGAPGQPARIGCGAEGVLEMCLELGRWFETLPGVSVNSISVTPARFFPSALEGLWEEAVFLQRDVCQATGSVGFDRIFCKEFSGGIFQFHMVTDLHEAIKDTFYSHRSVFK